MVDKLCSRLRLGPGKEGALGNGGYQCYTSILKLEWLGGGCNLFSTYCMLSVSILLLLNIYYFMDVYSMFSISYGFSYLILTVTFVREGLSTLLSHVGWLWHAQDHRVRRHRSKEFEPPIA